jgi:hypothetical protein
MVNAWFIFGGLALVGFGMGMAVMLPPTRVAKAGVSLYLVWAGFGLLGGFFPCDPGCAGQTWSGWIHRLLGEITSVCIVPVPLLIWLGVRSDPTWLGALGASVYGTYPVGAALRNIAGLLQWLCWCVYYLWIVVLGVKLLRAG